MNEKGLLIELLHHYAEDVEHYPEIGKLDNVFGQFLRTEPTKMQFQSALHGVPLTSGMLWEVIQYKKDSGGD